jgi:membrane associated rhomboid family serine protease
MRSPKRQLQALARGWSSGRSAVCIILIAANVACFTAQAIITHLSGGAEVLDIEKLFALSREGFGHHSWQLVTYMFLHKNTLHLLVNMLAFYFAGREVEAIVGPKHLLGIYFGGGILGGLADLAFRHSDVPLVGASGAVFAVLIAFTTILPEIELTVWLFFVVPIRLKAKYFAALLVGFSAVMVFLLPTFGNTSNLAHLGGCLLGWLYIKQLGYGNPLRIQRYVFARRQRAERYARMSPAQFISEEIDPILDKISRDGIHSLSRAEKRILEKGREKIARKITPRV